MWAVQGKVKAMNGIVDLLQYMQRLKGGPVSHRLFHETPWPSAEHRLIIPSL